MLVGVKGGRNTTQQRTQQGSGGEDRELLKPNYVMPGKSHLLSTTQIPECLDAALDVVYISQLLLQNLYPFYFTKLKSHNEHLDQGLS